ncbi:hypothetical protein D3C73_1485420 [compost metagenome]
MGTHGVAGNLRHNLGRNIRILQSDTAVACADNVADILSGQPGLIKKLLHKLVGGFLHMNACVNGSRV